MRVLVTPTALVCLLVGAICMVYAPVVDHAFVHLGEGEAIPGAPFLHEPLDGAWLRALLVPSTSWSVLGRVSLRIDAETFGLERAGPLLLVNVALHALASVLLLLALTRISRAPIPSALAAALFALHPLRVESVSRLDARGDLLALVLLFLALWRYAHRESARMSLRLESLLWTSLVVGALASPLMASLPFLLLVFDRWSQSVRAVDRRIDPRAVVVEKLPLFAVALASLLLLVWSNAQGPHAEFTSALAPRLRWTAPWLASATLLREILWPVGITSLHARSLQPAAWGAVAGAMLLVAALAAPALPRRARPAWWVAGASVWTLALLPCCLAASAWARDERWTALALLGIAMLVGFAVHAAIGARIPRIAGWGLGLALLAALSLLARAQVDRWQDERTLLEYAVEVDPSSWMAHDRLARLHAAEGRTGAALRHCLQTLALAPGFAAAQRELGHWVAQEGDLRAASLLHENAELTGWRDRAAAARLGPLLVRIGFDAAALPLLESALRDRPRSGEVHAALALVHARTGDTARARHHLDLALATAPVSSTGQFLLVWLLATSPEETLADPQLAAQRASAALDPDAPDPDLLDALGAALARQGEWVAAFETARRAARLAELRGWESHAAALRGRSLEYLQHRAWTEARTLALMEDPD